MIINVLVYDNLKFQLECGFWLILLLLLLLLLLLFFSSIIISIYLSILIDTGGTSLQFLGSTSKIKDSSFFLNSTNFIDSDWYYSSFYNDGKRRYPIFFKIPE